MIGPSPRSAARSDPPAELVARFKAGLDRLWPEGGVVLAVTYVLGMILRVLSGRGIAGGFLVVAALFLALTLLGWRGVVRLAARRRRWV